MEQDTVEKISTVSFFFLHRSRLKCLIGNEIYEYLSGIDQVGICQTVCHDQDIDGGIAAARDLRQVVTALYHTDPRDPACLGHRLGDGFRSQYIFRLL